VDPILFYTNVAGNTADEYRRDQLDSQLKSELLTALQPAFAKISAKNIDYTQLPGCTTELADALNDVLSKKWRDLRGIEIVSFGVNSVKANEEDEAKIQKIQMGSAISNPGMAAGVITDAQSDAMRQAASNESAGAAMAFMGMGMAGAAGGNAEKLFEQAAAQKNSSQNSQAAPAAGTWTCPSCGQEENTGNFCSNCGKPRPAAPASWTCPSCGQEGNTGNFCTNCGKPRPAAEWTCSCGQVNAGKFCSNCGKPRP
jgi:membrane protease subunit (stomatin/prohibitin family)